MMLWPGVVNLLWAVVAGTVVTWWELNAPPPPPPSSLSIPTASPSHPSSPSLSAGGTAIILTSDHHHSSTPPQLEYDNYGLTYDPDNNVVLPYAEEDVVTIGSSGGLEYDHVSVSCASI